MTDVYLNNKFIGTIDHAKQFVQNIIDERRKGSLPVNLNAMYDEKKDEVYVENSGGRVKRPLIIVKNGTPLLTEKHMQQLQKKELAWSDLVKQGIIEYLDAMEEEQALVAFTEADLTSDHTHLEISPLSMLGLTTSLVHYSNYTHSARINAGSKNQKQAIGVYAANFPVRMDMDVNILHTPQ